MIRKALLLQAAAATRPSEREPIPRQNVTEPEDFKAPSQDDMVVHSLEQPQIENKVGQSPDQSSMLTELFAGVEEVEKDAGCAEATADHGRWQSLLQMLKGGGETAGVSFDWLFTRLRQWVNKKIEPNMLVRIKRAAKEKMLANNIGMLKHSIHDSEEHLKKFKDALNGMINQANNLAVPEGQEYYEIRFRPPIRLKLRNGQSLDKLSKVKIFKAKTELNPLKGSQLMGKVRRILQSLAAGHDKNNGDFDTYFAEEILNNNSFRQHTVEMVADKMNVGKASQKVYGLWAYYAVDLAYKYAKAEPQDHIVGEPVDLLREHADVLEGISAERHPSREKLDEYASKLFEDAPLLFPYMWENENFQKNMKQTIEDFVSYLRKGRHRISFTKVKKGGARSMLEENGDEVDQSEDEDISIPPEQMKMYECGATSSLAHLTLDALIVDGHPPDENAPERRKGNDCCAIDNGTCLYLAIACN